MGLSLITDATNEPVLLPQLKTQVKVPQSLSIHDDELTRIAKAARKATERLTRRAWINQTWKLTLSSFPYGSRFIQLPRPPLVTVTSLAYVDSSSVSQTLTESTEFVKRINSHPGSIVLKPSQSWPTTDPEEMEAVTITYVAGYGTGSTTVPEEAKQAILALTDYWWMNPDKRDVPEFIHSLLHGLHCGMILGAYEVTA